MSSYQLIAARRPLVDAKWNPSLATCHCEALISPPDHSDYRISHASNQVLLMSKYSLLFYYKPKPDRVN